MSEIRANTISNAAGTGPVTLTKQSAAKAWVNFNGTGTIAARDSFNLSSLTDNGTGDYTINLTSAMADTNYCVSLSATDDGTTAGQTDGFAYGGWLRGANSAGYAAGSMRVQVGYPADSVRYDQSHVNLTLVGDLA